MTINEFPIEKINKFLNDHTFVVTDPLVIGLSTKYPLNVKVTITGIKTYISVGEPYPYLQYTLYLEPSNKVIDGMMNMMFGHHHNYNGEIDITTTFNPYSSVTAQVDQLLNRFLKVFSIDYRVMCTKIVNNII